jgi:hypothetical protein
MSPKLPIDCCRHPQTEKSKMKNTDITAQTLRGLLDYDPDTGIFRWLVSRSGIQMGAVAGTGSVSDCGYIRIKVNGTKFRAHRLAWLYTHGTWPDHQIDHINGNRADNRIANLRDVSQSTNMQNQTRPQKSNTSGFLGVSWHIGKKRWDARISVNERSQHLGSFDTAEEAHAAYLAAKLRLHPGDVRNLTGLPS